MFTLSNGTRRSSGGVGRRSFLKIGAFGAGLTLADMLRLRAQAEAVGSRSNRAKAVIMVYLGGGPSHIDTYDLKPDAPAEFRGEFEPIATNVPGVRICELFPAAGRHVGQAGRHSLPDPARPNIPTRWSRPATPRAINQTAHHPSIGAVVSKLRTTSDSAFPSSSACPSATARMYESPGDYPGYLGLAHRPFTPHGECSRTSSARRTSTPDRMGRAPVAAGQFRSLRRRPRCLRRSSRGWMPTPIAPSTWSPPARCGKALDLSNESLKVLDRYDARNQEILHAGAATSSCSPAGWSRPASAA